MNIITAGTRKITIPNFGPVVPARPGGVEADPNNPGTTNLISWWSLDEASGTRADSHGSNDLTDNNTVTQAAGKVGNAAQFVAANLEYLSHADNDSLRMGDIDFTIGLWVYLDSKATQTLLGKFLTTGFNREYWITYNNATDRFQFDVSLDGDSGASIITVTANSFGSPSTATWYFILCWHDATGNTLNIQINNETVDSVAHATGVKAGTSTFSIGRLGDASANYTNGRVDEAFIYKTIFDTDGRAWFYNEGNGRAYSDLNP